MPRAVSGSGTTVNWCLARAMTWSRFTVAPNAGPMVPVDVGSETGAYVALAASVVPAKACASKAALEQFTAVAAREFGARGITVNTVSPGATDTDMLRETNPPEALERTAELTALRRLGQPGDIAAVVASLAGSDAQWITGQNIRATGGLLV